MPSAGPADEMLLDAWREGDRAAGDRLFSRYYESIYRFFRSKTDADVRDLVQATFEGCVKGRDRFRGAATFRTYLFSIARYTLLAHFRKERNNDRFDALVDSAMDCGAGPSTEFARRQEETIVHTALRRIPVDLQLVLELYYWEGMSGAAMGEVLGVNENTARSRLRRAKLLLGRAIEEVAADPLLRRNSLAGLEDRLGRMATLITGATGSAATDTT